jgi:hypothetical protein
MNPLTDVQRTELRQELERQLGKLEKSMTVTDEALKPVELDQAAVGRLSRMDSLQNQSMAKGLRETRNAPACSDPGGLTALGFRRVRHVRGVRRPDPVRAALCIPRISDLQIVLTGASPAIPAVSYK